jgi:phospholipid/cholesterol/gamma-HCH transport system ATP-binding protein
MIEVTGLTKTYGGRSILKGVDIAIADGETLVLIGGSGCGKSTFLKCVIGLVKPNSGQIMVDGVDTTQLKDEDAIAAYRRKFGYLFQEAALFDSLSVWENVSFGLRYLTEIPPADYRRIATEKLAMVGLKDVEDHMPSELSGGMKKRVGLARAIAAGASYILYDEPTTGLDPVMSDVISDLILDLQKKLKVTSLVVTHDMKSAYKIATHIAMIHQGKLQEVGTPDQIRATKDPIVRQFIEGSSAGPVQMAVER